MPPLAAPVSVVAARAIASKVGWTSVGELEMTRRISAVAVCRSSASRVSVSSRAFSIAITACAAKFCNNAIGFAKVCAVDEVFAANKQIGEGARHWFQRLPQGLHQTLRNAPEPDSMKPL